MDKFIIYLREDFISVSGFETEQIPLRNEGEERFQYSPDLFWEWFKEKIDYNEEELSFIVVTDRESFVIPNEIQIAKKSSFKELPILPKYQNTKIYTFPKLEKREKQVILKKDKEKTFADYFVSKRAKMKY